ncbi:MAG: hypothetical protein H6694_09560 [Candidatus Latescibacteria bacterium]|nr:hypothetical protein [Candidatus Latescibacterota bacterium]
MDGSLLQYILGLVVGSTGLLLMLAATPAVMRRASAAQRHQVLLGGFLVLAVLPAASFCLPSLEVRLPDFRKEVEAPSRPEASVPAEPQVDLPRLSSSDAHRPVPTAAIKAHRRFLSPSIITWLAFGTWLLGLVVVLAVQLVRWLGIGVVAAMATVWEDETPEDQNAEPLSARALAVELSAELGFRRPIVLLRSELAGVAMAWGLRHPCVILPTESTTWPSAKLEAILRHELWHIRRLDNWVHFLAIWSCALYWFNPLVWIAFRQLLFEREVACDDHVLNSGVKSSTYADCLMEVAMKLGTPSHKSIMPVGMAHASNLKARLLRTLAEGQNRRPSSKLFAASCFLALLVLTAPLSTIRILGGVDPVIAARAAVGDRLNGTPDLVFNGGGSHVVVPDSDEFDFAGDFTIEARVKVANLSQQGQNRLLISKHLSHAQGGEWSMTILGPPNPVGEVRFSVWDGTNGYVASSSPGAIGADSEHCEGWQVIAFSYDRDTASWWMFVDGQVVGSGTGVLNIGQTDRELWIGWEIGEPSHNFNGWIRAVRISDSARYTSAYNAASPWTSDAHTVAHWDFREGAGSVLHDVSGNGHDGAIYGAEWDTCLGNIIEVEPGTPLQPVIDAAPDGAEIVLLAGEHEGPAVFAGRTLSLRGVGVEQTALNARDEVDDYTILVTDGGHVQLSDLTLGNCWNSAPGEYYYPAALTVDEGIADVQHCLLQNNLNAIAAWRDGSLVNVSESTFLTDVAVAAITREATAGTTVALTKCTVKGERTDADHGLIKMWGGAFEVNQCILDMPLGRAVEWHSGILTGSCNIVHAAIQTNGPDFPGDPLNVDPLFCSLEGWAYLVMPQSPAIPGNNDCGVAIGSGGSCATGVESTSWSRVKSLY